MATAAELRAGIATRLKTIAGLKVYERPPAQFDFPCAVVDRGMAEPEQTFGRGDLTMWNFDVSIMVSPRLPYDQQQTALDAFLNTSSTGGIYTAIHNDRRLGGKAHTTFVREIGEDLQFGLSEDVAARGVSVRLEVWAS